MKDLLNAIKLSFSGNPSLSPYAGRITYGRASEKLLLSDGPYIVVVLVGDLESGYGYNASSRELMEGRIQIGVYAEGLAVADTLRQTIQTHFHAIAIDNGTVGMHLRHASKGLQVIPSKDAGAKTVYHAYSVFAVQCQ